MILQILVNGLAYGSLIALVSLGFGLIHTVARFFHFAHGAVLAIGGYTAYFLIVTSGLPALISIALAIVVSGATGAYLYTIVYRRLQRLQANSLVLLLTSLGLYIILQNMISLLFKDQSQSLHSSEIDSGIDILGTKILLSQAVIIISSATACASVGFILWYTKIGKSIRAIASDVDLAMVVGINVERIILSTFIIGSSLAGLAAVLIAYDTKLTPTMGFNLLLPAATGYILGGVGSMRGAVIGGLLIGVIQNAAGWWLPSHWQTSIVFVVLILVLSLRPQGLFGQLTRKTII